MNIPFKFDIPTILNFQKLNDLRIPITLTFLNYLAIFSIFTDAFSYYQYLRVPLVVMAIVLTLLIIKNKKIYFNKTFLILFCFSGVISLISITLGYASLPRFLLQFIGILFSAFGFYYLIRINNNDLLKIFKIYMQVVFVMSLLGIFQQISHFLRFTPGYEYGWLHHDLFSRPAGFNLLRTNIIVLEPTDLAFIMMPACFASFVSFFKDGYKFIERWKALIVLLVFISTFSTTGYGGIIVALLLLLINYRKFKYILIILLLTSLFVYSAYSYSPEVNFRMNTLNNIITGKVKISWLMEGSWFSLLSNATVSLMSFKDNPFFGYGIGSYETTYNRYIEKVVDLDSPLRKGIGYRVNWNDAASLFFRLLSETGLFGILAFFVFIIRFYVLKNNDPSNYLWIISNSVLCLFLIRLVRGGHYFYGGFFLFIWLYYFSKLNANKLEEKERM